MFLVRILKTRIWLDKWTYCMIKIGKRIQLHMNTIVLIVERIKLQMVTIIFFLHATLFTVWKLDTHIFDLFCSVRHIHQTAVPVIHLEVTCEIMFNDNDRNIMAQRSGTISPTTQAKRCQFYIKHNETR